MRRRHARGAHSLRGFKCGDGVNRLGPSALSRVLPSPTHPSRARALQLASLRYGAGRRATETKVQVGDSENADRRFKLALARRLSLPAVTLGGARRPLAVHRRHRGNRRAPYARPARTAQQVGRPEVYPVERMRTAGGAAARPAPSGRNAAPEGDGQGGDCEAASTNTTMLAPPQTSMCLVCSVAKEGLRRLFRDDDAPVRRLLYRLSLLAIWKLTEKR